MSAIVPEWGPADELLQLDPNKVVALKMNAQRLQRLRESRGAQWQGAMQPYADPQKIAHELAEFNRLVAKHGWKHIDVSYKAVEDVAADIARMLEFEAPVTV